MTPPTVPRIQSTWQTISLIGTWIITVAGSFLLPLPQWASEQENTSFTQLIYFIATVIAGFVLIYTFINRNKKTWLYIAIVFFIIVVSLFFVYSAKREALTAHYDGKDIVIGTVYVDGFEEKLHYREQKTNRKLSPNEMIRSAGGDINLIWTRDSIDASRWTLIFLLLSSYMACAVFLISFVNAFFLFKKETGPDNIVD